MPTFRFSFTHDDLPRALREAAKDAPDVPDDAVQSRIEAAKSSGGVAFFGQIGAKDRATAKQFLLDQAHDRFHGIEGVSEGYQADTRSLGIDPDELTLKLEEVKSDG